MLSDGQLDAAQKAVSQVINLHSGKGEQYDVCQCYTLLGQIHQSKGKTNRALTHFETALRVASPFNWHHQLPNIHPHLAKLFSGQGKFNEANSHVERVKLHAISNSYRLGHTIYLQARVWYKEQRFGEAKYEVLDAVAIFEKLVAAQMLENCEKLLNSIEVEMNK